MIYIDISKLDISEEWKEEARRLSEKLRKISESGRSNFINRNSNIWQRLKPKLEKLSHHKCWYCERKRVREDFQIDHYRPKNRVKNKDGSVELGYWWLAFDYRNFRIACSYCNCPHAGPNGIARGKLDQFPLLHRCIRASSPDSNLDDEMPLLLDPTNRSDPPLLWFQMTGEACPSFSDDDGFLYERAKETIQILNLNDIRIVEARRDLYLDCMRVIERGDMAFKHYNSGSPTGRKEFETAIGEISKMIQPSVEFSAAAYAYFRGSSYEWVRYVVQSIDRTVQ